MFGIAHSVAPRPAHVRPLVRRSSADRSYRLPEKKGPTAARVVGSRRADEGERGGGLLRGVRPAGRIFATFGSTPEATFSSAKRSSAPSKPLEDSSDEVPP